MGQLNGQNIVLGISGSIAAYKSAHLTRLLIKAGYNVKVIMTDAATKFISPLTLSTLSKNEVYTDFFVDGTWSNHVDLGLWADLFIIAPCTATTLSKLADGHANNMLIASYLSAKCPVAIAPAMDLDMWRHGSTLTNLSKLKSYGNHIIDVGHGELASGLVGDGRMAEPEDIVAFTKALLQPTQDLKGKNILVTAGPTHEALDPVRFIGNRSSGKMGIALAFECENRGANVHLVLGPNSINPKLKSGTVIDVKSAEDMFVACEQIHTRMDGCIFAAAVADYRPQEISSQKIKKADNDMSIALERTTDIAKTLGMKKSTSQIHIGFALETNNEMKHALAKITKKNFDAIVLNSLNDKGAGFQHDTNKVKIIDKDSIIRDIPLKSKKEVSVDIIDTLVRLIADK